MWHDGMGVCWGQVVANPMLKPPEAFSHTDDICFKSINMLICCAYQFGVHIVVVEKKILRCKIFGRPTQHQPSHPTPLHGGRGGLAPTTPS